jgi:hypothetical protein
MKPAMTIHSTSSEYGSIIMGSLRISRQWFKLGAGTLECFNDVSPTPSQPKLQDFTFVWK